MKALILDCDGTLYQDLDFDRVYYEFILRGRTDFTIEDLHVLTEQIVHGQVLTMNTKVKIPTQPVHTLKELKEQLAHLETAPLSLQPDPAYTYLGDLWAIVSLIAKCIGVSSEISSQAFYHTRAWQEERLVKHERLNEAIANCTQHMTTCLLTNSPEDTARPFIEKLGLSNLFSMIVTDAHKPYGLKQAIHQYHPQLLETMSEITIIGDHFFNDLFQFQNEGASTVWMNPYPLIHKPMVNQELHTLDELADFIDALTMESK